MVSLVVYLKWKVLNLPIWVKRKAKAMSKLFLFMYSHPCGALEEKCVLDNYFTTNLIFSLLIMNSFTILN
jgi:hypothetical protein